MVTYLIAFQAFVFAGGGINAAFTNSQVINEIYAKLIPNEIYAKLIPNDNYAKLVPNEIGC